MPAFKWPRKKEVESLCSVCMIHLDAEELDWRESECLKTWGARSELDSVVQCANQRNVSTALAPLDGVRPIYTHHP